MRQSINENHLATAEVANIVLEQANEVSAAQKLTLWFELFRESYLLSKTRMKKDLSRPALMRYLQADELSKQNLV
jgi:DTW domain-containing protein YfiP